MSLHFTWSKLENRNQLGLGGYEFTYFHKLIVLLRQHDDVIVFRHFDRLSVMHKEIGYANCFLRAVNNLLMLISLAFLGN